MAPTSCRCGIRCGWPRITRWPTSLTGGRVIFGVGRGYHTREVETFGAPLIDQNASREMFEEGVEILFKAFAGEPFSHQGK